MKKITLLVAIFAAFTMNAQVTIWEDGFESYDDFSFDVIGGYSQIDVDGDATYGSSDYDFTNENYTGTAIVFNPSMTTPAATGTVWDAMTGDKGLYFVASTGDVSGSPVNDDYFITPQIDFSGAVGSSFSFWAKTLTDTWGLEKFEVLLSTTGTAIADFTVDLGGAVLEAPIDYTEYSYDLSAYDGQQVYIAIHYMATDTFVLQMDDFLAEAASLSVADNSFENFSYSLDANSNLSLKANLPIESIQLFNILGQEVVSQKLANTNEIVSISSLETGIYIVNVSINGQSKSFKIIKN